MKVKSKIGGVLAGLLILTGIAGCSGSAVKEVLQSDEKLTIGNLMKEEFPEKEIQADEAAFYYGYGTLSEEEKTIYRQLMKGIEEMQEEITLNAVSEERLAVIYNMMMIDHPEYFWIEGAYSYYSEEWPDGSEADMKVIPVYVAEKQEAEVLKRQIETKAEEWISQVPSDADTYGKIKSIYETLIRQVSYDIDAENNQNIRSVFLGGSTVCMGYSKATQYLLNKMGIFCTLVTGVVEGVNTDNPAHAWNLVKIGEQYYYVDTTWGNPGYTETPAPGMEIYYNFLCCNDAALAETHTANDDIPLPACVDDSYNYYKLKGCWYETFDRNQMYQIIQENASNESHITELYFSTGDVYDQAVQELVNGTLIQEAVQNASWLQAGQTVSWQVYYGGSYNLLVIIWN